MVTLQKFANGKLAGCVKIKPRAKKNKKIKKGKDGMSN